MELLISLRFVALRDTPDKLLPVFQILDFVNVFNFPVDTLFKPRKTPAKLKTPAKITQGFLEYGHIKFDCVMCNIYYFF